MSTIPWSDNKNARQVYREWVDVWGATWEGDTSDGHHVFRFPNGHESTVAHSPSAGHSWVKARRDEAAKITGRPFRGKRNTHAAKARALKFSATQRAEREQTLARLASWERAHQLRQRINDIDHTIRNIRSRLPRLTTMAQRAYAENAIHELATERTHLELTIASIDHRAPR